MGPSDASLVLPACGFGVRFTERIMGIAACAFVILMIPELWKNPGKRLNGNRSIRLLFPKESIRGQDAAFRHGWT